jgi:hypothetical protein
VERYSRLFLMKEAALKLGFASETEFDRVVDAAKMKPYES